MLDEPVPHLSVVMTVEQLWQPAPGGSATYILELAAALARIPGIRTIGAAAAHRGSARPASGLPTTMPVEHSRLPRSVMYESWSRIRTPLMGPASARRSDVVHATTWAVPPTRRPLVATVHDLAFLHEPHHFTRRGNAFFRRALDVVTREADVVVTPSTATAEDCVQHGIAEARIRVIPHGVRVPPVAAADVAAFRAQHGLQRPYVLWCGTFEPRKNVATLLQAFVGVAAEQADLDLVLVGPTGWGGVADDIRRRVKAVTGARVHLLGRLPETDLHRAYAGARAFCFPSSREGFGMPVLEALAHGIPVVTSQGTSMAEIVSPDVALLVDPTSVDELAAALLEACGVRREELARGAVAHAAGFTWARSAHAHLAAYRDAVRLGG